MTAAAPQTLRLRLSKPQTRAFRALGPGKTVCAPWGRGVGKSYFVRILWYLLVSEWDGRRIPGAKHDGIRIVLLMPTLEQAKKVHGHLMLAELEGDWSFLGAKVDRTTWRISFPGGSWIQWVTAERARNIRGLRCDAIFVDECDDVEITTFDAICVPWLSEPHSLKQIFLSGTPTRGRHGLLYKTYRLGVDGAPGHAAFHATYLDVPEHVDNALVERQRAFTDKALFAREWLADFDAAEGLVYPHFAESFHVREPHPQTTWTEVLVGIDWGYEDPGVILVAGVAGSGRDATVHLLEEVYRQHETLSWWIGRAAEVKARYARYRQRWYADPSQPAAIEQMRREAGVPVAGADNAIEDGVTALADRIARRQPEGGAEYARLYVSRACKNTIREFGVYRRKRDPKDRDRVLDTIEDKANHAMDAARYLTFTRFGKPPGIKIEVC